MEKDLITIGITSFNSFKTIKKAIDSAIDQRWINKEILVVDDSSNDGSWEIIKNYEKYSNIRLFRNPKNAPPNLDVTVAEPVSSTPRLFTQ